MKIINSKATKKTWKKLDPEELMKDIELEPKSCHSDFDVLLAVAKAARMRLQKETLMLKHQHRPLDLSAERSYNYSVIEIREPGTNYVRKDDIIDCLKTASVSGGRFDDDHGIRRYLPRVDHHHHRSMPGLKNLTDYREKVLNKTIKLAYPEGMPRDEILRRERFLKKPAIYYDKNYLRNDHKRRVRFEDSDTEEKEEEERIRSKKRPSIVKKEPSPSKTLSKKAAKPGAMWTNVPPPDMPIEFRNRIEKMGGTEVKLVIQKFLQKTDCSSSHGRLSIPLNAVVEKDFLGDGEKEYLKIVTEKGLNFILALLIEPDLETVEIKFRQWNMEKTTGNASREYVLNKPWNDVVRRNGLQRHDWLQLWSFRVDGRLCLALVKLPDMPNETSTSTSLEEQSSTAKSN